MPIAHIAASDWPRRTLPANKFTFASPAKVVRRDVLGGLIHEYHAAA